MPTPNIQIDSDDEDVESPKSRPEPLVRMPVLSVMTDGEDESEETDSDAEYVMTAEEEAAAKRYLSGQAGQTERRMSSLDVYLAQPQTTSESLIIHRRLSMREEEEAIAKMNAEEADRKDEQSRREKLEQEREAVKRERRAKSEQKKMTETGQSSSPNARRMTFKKRGFGGLSKERRKKLKEIIMKKAKEELKAERLKELRARENHLNSVVPQYSVDGLTDVQLKDLLQNWHHRIKESFEQRLEWEEKLRKQNEEIEELTRKLVDIKGKYPLPILRKVPKKENILARLEKLRAINAISTIKPDRALKSVTKNTESGTIINS